MPEPRKMSGREGVRALAVTYEPPSRDSAAARRRYRHGTMPMVGRGSGGKQGGGSLPVEVRNGLPEFRPYVYRGLGYDQLGDDDE